MIPHVPQWAGIAATFAVVALVAWSPRPARGDAVVGTGTPGSCTEAALNAALAGGGNVTFNCGANPVTITVTSTKGIAGEMSIDGGGLLTLSGGGRAQVFNVSAGATLSIANLIISEGQALSGGGIYNSGTLTVTNSTFAGNSADSSIGSGGAIGNAGTLMVTNSTFSTTAAPTKTLPKAVPSRTSPPAR